MKKMLSVCLAAVVLVSALAGCSGGGKAEPAINQSAQPSASAPADSSQPAGAAKAVTLWYYWETPLHQETLGKVIQNFNGSQSAVKVEAKYVPFADFKKQLSIGATVSELPDIVIIDSPDLPSYAAMGIFADITGKFDMSQYYDGPKNSCTYDGKLYGVPFGSNCLALFYNEDMLKAAGQSVPTTWAELRAAAKALTTDKVSGLAFCCLQNEEGTFNFMPWVWATGTDSFNLNNDKGISAIKYVSDLVKDGSMTKEVINWTQGDVMNQFISGNVAMMINGPWQVPTMRKEAPNLKWNVALIPKGNQNASVLGGENLAVIKNDNVDSSLAFLKYMTSPDILKTYIDVFGYIASRKDVAEGQFTDDPIMKQFIAQMQYAQPRGPHPRWPEISDAISLAFNEAITGVSTPEAAAAKAQTTIDSIVKG